jgi:hypothetical protein
MICMDSNTFSKISMVFIIDVHRFSQILPWPPAGGMEPGRIHFTRFPRFSRLFTDFRRFCHAPGGGARSQGAPLTWDVCLQLLLLFCVRNIVKHVICDLEGSSMAPQ